LFSQGLGRFASTMTRGLPFVLRQDALFNKLLPKGSCTTRFESLATGSISIDQALTAGQTAPITQMEESHVLHQESGSKGIESDQKEKPQNRAFAECHFTSNQ
jgi:hypothetical protein